MARGELPAPDDDVAADRYELADDRLAAAGLRWYEVSNWARDRGGRVPAQPRLLDRRRLVGRRARARTATSAGCRWWNVKHPRRTPRGWPPGSRPAAAREVLDATSRRIERVLLRLRLRVRAAAGRARRRRPRRGPSARRRRPAGRAGARPAGVVLTRRGRLLADAVVRDLLVPALLDPRLGDMSTTYGRHVTPERGSKRGP